MEAPNDRTGPYPPKRDTDLARIEQQAVCAQQICALLHAVHPEMAELTTGGCLYEAIENLLNSLNRLKADLRSAWLHCGALAQLVKIVEPNV